MPATLDTLGLRRPNLHYTAPPVCDTLFSSSGFVTIILNELHGLVSPTGLELGGVGNVFLTWNTVPGALCYSVYKSSDPFGTFTIVAECIPNPPIDLTPFGPGNYRVSAITKDGESPLSIPITFSPVIPCNAFLDAILDTNGQNFFAGAAGGNEAGVTSGLPNAVIYTGRTNLNISGTIGLPSSTGQAANKNAVFAGSATDGGATNIAWWYDFPHSDFRVILTDAVNEPTVFGINSSGQVLLDIIIGAAHRTKFYDPGSNTVTDVGLLDPSGQSSAAPGCITDNGWIGVQSTVTTPSSHDKASLYHGGVLFSIAPADAGNNNSDVVDVNTLGHAVGTYTQDITFLSRSFYWDGAVSTRIIGFGDLEVDVLALNDSDEAVGSADNGASIFVPFRWTPGGGIVALPLLPGATSGQARDVNAAGVIVGDGDTGGFIYFQGATHSVIDFVPAAAGLSHVFFMWQISDDNYVRGFGIVNGTPQNFVAKLCLD